jgi:ABC-type bacteriocin/lantibiotic exporter with double-glycine peptidase domain
MATLLMVFSPHGLDKLAALLHGGSYLDDAGVIKQQRRNDCAIACAAMFLKELGHAQKYRTLSAEMPLTNRGASMQELIDVLHRYGIQTFYKRIDRSRLDELPLPAIAFVNGNHFVVIEDVQPHRIIVEDPSIGRVAFYRPIFNLTWDGDVLIPPSSP